MAGIQSPPESFDVVIIGGGLVGATLALLLNAAGDSAPCRIALIEKADLAALADGTSAGPSFDGRSTALSLSSEGVLQELGLWQQLRPLSAPITHVHVSEQERWGVTRLHADDQGLDHYGHVTPNAVLGQALWQGLSDLPGLTLFSPVSVDQVRPGDSVTHVDLSDGAVLNGKLIVLAEGGRSPLMQRLGIAVDTHDYGQMAFVANMEPAQATDGWAFERFTKDGAMAVLPLPDFDAKPRTALVWTAPSRQAEAIRSLSPKGLTRAIDERFGGRLGGVVRVGELVGYPLQRVLAREQVRNGLVILGNAAHAMHPIAGQGFNLSLRDAHALAQHIRTHSNFHTLSALDGYARSRRADQAVTMLSTDVLLAAFAGKNRMLKQIRQAGLIGLELVPGIKQQVARFGMAEGRVAGGV